MLFLFKWLRRFFALIAVKLALFAIFLTIMRIAFINVEEYKDSAIVWISTEYQIDAQVADISAGVDFSGIYLSLNDLAFSELDKLPFKLKSDHLFLHIDFWNSLTNLRPTFSKVSIVGLDVDLAQEQQQEQSEKRSDKNDAVSTSSTLKTLEDVLLTRWTKFNVSDAKIHYFDNLKNKKSILIKNLQWKNNDNLHQGIGQVSLDAKSSTKYLAFVVNLNKSDDKELAGELYVHASHLNLLSYIDNKANKLAKISKAKISGEVWVDFTASRVSNIQVKMDDIELAWRMQDKKYNWNLDSGSLQFSNSSNGWLLDSYNVNVQNNNEKIKGLSVSGVGTKNNASIDFSGLNLARAIPLYQLFSSLSKENTSIINNLSIDGLVKNLKIERDENGEFSASVSLRHFKNRPTSGIPGISNAKIDIYGGLNSGTVNIRLPKQKIYFDGEFNRPFPVKSADIPLQWQQTETGLKLFSDQTLLVTNELDTITSFSVFFGNEKSKTQSPFLSLYTYASLNNAGQVDHYYPINAMGHDVYDYLLPTLKKGTVKGAKILWYGAFSDYPYDKHDGIFQAYVPVKNAKFNFYEGWEGLTKLDLDLLFENDWLTMKAKKATLGPLKIDKLYGKIDRLHPKGTLTINAQLTEDAQKASDYLSHSPYKDSVGSALKIIDVHKDLNATLKIVIPFNQKNKKTKMFGKVKLNNNNINLKLADDIEMPLKNVNGSFSFVDGDLKTENITAHYLKQPLSFTIKTKEGKKSYNINAKLSAKWALDKFTSNPPLFKYPILKGELDWHGNVDFAYEYGKGYRFDVKLDSVLQGLSSELPSPLHKTPYQKWPLNIHLTGNDASLNGNVTLANKLAVETSLKSTKNGLMLSYLDLQIGPAAVNKQTDKTKQIVNVNLKSLDVGAWYDIWQRMDVESLSKNTAEPKKTEENLVTLNAINVDIEKLLLFGQPLKSFKTGIHFNDKNMTAKIDSDLLVADVKYRKGMPQRFDIQIDKLDFHDLNLPTAKDVNEPSKLFALSDNMRVDYPEIFLKCEICLWNEMDFSPLTTHIYPTKKRLKIEYLTIGEEGESTSISGVWDQQRTNVVTNISGKNNQSILQRLNYSNSITYKKLKVNGELNWVGAPWDFNMESLNGTVSAHIENGSITEVNDAGTRFLSVFSLDGIRRTLNLEYGNIFDKGFNFDVITTTANIKKGVFKSDDFYLNGSAGKIAGKGLVDIPNFKTNSTLSYSPAVSGSLPVLAAFVISPITGAAALVLSKLIQPAVESIVRIDFSVKGDLSDPVIKIVGQKKGKVKLEDIEESVEQ